MNISVELKLVWSWLVTPCLGLDFVLQLKILVLRQSQYTGLDHDLVEVVLTTLGCTDHRYFFLFPFFPFLILN